MNTNNDSGDLLSAGGGAADCYLTEEEWINPNYTFVDIHKYEMSLVKSRRIEDFCIQFFKDWELYSDIGDTEKCTDSQFLVDICYQVAKKEQENFQQITKALVDRLTLENFDGTFQRMCTLLFENGTDVREELVVSLLAFTMTLHGELMCRNHTTTTTITTVSTTTTTATTTAWYTWELHCTSLVHALSRADFNPNTFSYKRNNDILQSIFTTFIAIIPQVLCFYILLR